MIYIGMNGRFFPNNWRPAKTEINFCKKTGFHALQFGGKEKGLSEDDLGTSLEELGDYLQANAVMPVMEILLRLDEKGKTSEGYQPINVLHANMNAITKLKCQAVHWHLVAPQYLENQAVETLEIELQSQLKEAVQLAHSEGFRFGIEHNEPEQKMFNNPSVCERALLAVEGLGLVWDFNHSASEQVADYKRLIPYMTMLHVSDTPLPASNYHLPLGMGNLDFADYLSALIAYGFDGAAILEIGGLPKSGGYNRDTDEALQASLAHLQTILTLIS